MGPYAIVVETQYLGFDVSFDEPAIEGKSDWDEDVYAVGGNGKPDWDADVYAVGGEGKSDWDADVYAIGAEQKKTPKAVGAWMADSQPNYVWAVIAFILIDCLWRMFLEFRQSAIHPLPLHNALNGVG